MEKPKVSVVIPCYNAGHFVQDAITSVEKQTIADQLELVIVNDGSTDKKTIEKLRELEAQGYNVVNQKNMGLSEARNSGVKVAKGKYILCLDADDMIKPTFLEKTVEVFEKDDREDLGIVATWIECFGHADEVWKPLSYDPIYLMVSNILSVGALFKREAWEKVGGYKSKMNGSSVEGKLGGYEDWEFWISITEKGYKWEVVEETLLLYRRTKNSMISFSREKHDELFGRILDIHEDYYKDHYREVISKLMKQVNFLTNILAEKEKNELKLLGIGSAALARIKEDPRKLLELNNYRRLARRIVKKKK